MVWFPVKSNNVNRTLYLGILLVLIFKNEQMNNADNLRKNA